MSELQKSIVLWLAVILVIAYLLNINIFDVLSSIGHALQQVHNSNAHGQG